MILQGGQAHPTTFWAQTQPQNTTNQCSGKAHTHGLSNGIANIKMQVARPNEGLRLGILRLFEMASFLVISHGTQLK